MWRMTGCDRSVWAEPATREPWALRPVWLDGERSKFRCEGAARPGVPQLAYAGFAGPMFRFYCSLVVSARPRRSSQRRSHQTIQPRPDMSAPKSARVVTKIHTRVSRSAHKRMFERDEVAERRCEGCHGAGAEHVDGGGDPARIRSFAGHPRTPFRKPAPAATKRSSVTGMPRSV